MNPERAAKASAMADPQRSEALRARAVEAEALLADQREAVEQVAFRTATRDVFDATDGKRITEPARRDG